MSVARKIRKTDLILILRAFSARFWHKLALKIKFKSILWYFKPLTARKISVVLCEKITQNHIFRGKPFLPSGKYGIKKRIDKNQSLINRNCSF